MTTWLLGQYRKNSFLIDLFEGSAGSIRTIFNFCTAALFISSVVFYKGDYYGLSVFIFLIATIFLVATSAFASMTKEIV
jgi:hypothetical protein